MRRLRSERHRIVVWITNRAMTITRLLRASIPSKVTGAGRLCRGQWIDYTSYVYSALFVGTLSACAPAMPALTGGEITPWKSADFAIGGAARVGLGKLHPDDNSMSALSAVESGGVSPIVATRVAVDDNADLGLRLSGSVVQVEGRYGLKLTEELTFIGGVLPYLGWLPLRDTIADEKVGGIRYGAYSPWVLAMSVGGIYEAWTGLCFSIDGASGTLGKDTSVSGFGIRPGALIGFGVGFHHLHALVELTVNHEWWRVEQDDKEKSLSGFSLTPAFALRLRF
jgi:hypothetical protein